MPMALIHIHPGSRRVSSSHRWPLPSGEKGVGGWSPPSSVSQVHNSETWSIALLRGAEQMWAPGAHRATSWIPRTHISFCWLPLSLFLVLYPYFLGHFIKLATYMQAFSQTLHFAWWLWGEGHPDKRSSISSTRHSAPRGMKPCFLNLYIPSSKNQVWHWVGAQKPQLNLLNKTCGVYQGRGSILNLFVYLTNIYCVSYVCQRLVW